MTLRWVSLKAKFAAKQLRFRGIDSTGAGAEVKNCVIEIEFHLKILDNLAVEAIAKEDLLAGGLRKRGSCQRGKQLTS